MKTVPFSDILASVCQLVGLDRTTLNDKSFGAIRDFTARRLSVIWDREDWPDVQRYMYTWPGMPVSSVEGSINLLADEDGEPLATEDSQDLYSENGLDTNTTKVYFDTDFKRIYLQDFANDRYKKGTIGQSYLKFLNPFYVSLDGGDPVAIDSQEYQFSYLTATDDIGEYITSVTIETPYNIATYDQYAGPNAPLTAKVIFKDNPQLLIQIPVGSLQGLSIYSQDPRQTTRAIPLQFIVEDFTDQTPEQFGYDVSYLRTFRSDRQFVQYRLLPPRFYGLKYDAGSNYTAGAQIYFDLGQGGGGYNISDKSKPSNGDFFLATTNMIAGISPINQTAENWQPLKIPARFRDYLANSVSSDFLKSEGRTEEAMMFEQLAEASVQQQIDVLIRQQGQNQKLNMVYTY